MKMKEKNYILGLDVGNTNTIICIFKRDDSYGIIKHQRLETKIYYEDLESIVLSFLKKHNLSSEMFQALIYSSVVPDFNKKILKLSKHYFTQTEFKLIAVSHDMGLPLSFRYPKPSDIGADRLVNACAAVKIYGGDLIVVDMGTASTFCVIHSEGLHLGGCIAPGINIAMKSLFENTAQLPTVKFSYPQSGIIGKSTETALQAGFFYSCIGSFQSILTKIKEENPKRNYKIIATGGHVEYINKHSPKLFDIVDPLLTLKGLKCIYEHLS